MLEQDFFASQPENTDRLSEDRKINDYTSKTAPLPGECCCTALKLAAALRVSLQSLSVYRHQNEARVSSPLSGEHL